MGSTYAGIDEFPEDFTEPDDGDDEDASSVNIPIEAIANRTIFLRNRSGGAAAATLAALTAIAAPKNTWLRFVENYGWYYFDSASVLAVASPYVLAADDATPGRWLHESLALRNAANGIAGLDVNKQLTIFDDVPAYPVFQGPRTVSRAVSLHGALFRQSIAIGGPDKEVIFLPNDAAYSQWQGVIHITSEYGAISLSLDPFLHDGATLSSVLVNVQGATSHGVLPDDRMMVGLFRRPINSSVLSSMVSAADFTEDPVNTIAAYEVPHSFSVVPDQLNVIDRSTNHYYLQFWGEGGTGWLASTWLMGLKLTMTGIADMRFP